jgi:hypothetical protein
MHQSTIGLQQEESAQYILNTYDKNWCLSCRSLTYSLRICRVLKGEFLQPFCDVIQLVLSLRYYVRQRQTKITDKATNQQAHNGIVTTSSVLHHKQVGIIFTAQYHLVGIFGIRFRCTRKQRVLSAMVKVAATVEWAQFANLFEQFPVVLSDFIPDDFDSIFQRNLSNCI